MINEFDILKYDYKSDPEKTPKESNYYNQGVHPGVRK